MKPIRFALVGSGAIAPTHARVITTLDGAQLAAIHSTSAFKGGELARQFGCVYHADYTTMLADPSVDAVVICTPSGTHAAQAIQAARAGKHVIVEKPLALTLEEADAVLRCCRENGVQLGTILQRRFSPGVVKLKRLIAEGRLGILRYAGCYAKLYRSQEYYDSGSWRGTWQLDGGGVLMNHGIHYVDLLVYLAGPVKMVTARCATLGHERIEVEDTATALLTFANGAMGVMEATTNAWPGLSSRIDLYGSEGSAVIENDELAFVSLKSGEEYRARPVSDQAGVSSPAVADDCHAAQYAGIVASLQAGEPLAVDGREGRKALEIILAVYQSAYSGQTSHLPLADSRFLTDLAREGFGHQS